MALLIPAVLLLLGLVSILLITITTEDVKKVPVFIYGIVLDAGSSHTALYIYKWLSDKQNGTGVVTQHSGGISSYVGQQGAAGRSLEACLNQAVDDIPKETHTHTPVYLGATAGMRLLQKSSPDVSDQILQEVEHKIQSYPFKYQGASILSGQEEGVFGWVTVNYLLENFIKYSFTGHWFRPKKPTMGALDFGGASTQITFSTDQNMEEPENVMKLRLYGYNYTLYTHSYLCYGQDQVLKRLLVHIYKSQSPSETLTHPCYPVGYSLQIKLNTIFNSPCTAKLAPSTSGYDPHGSVMVLGGGHYEFCVGNVSQMFSFNSCSYSRCSFDNVFQPNVSGSFMAFSAFFYVHSFLQRLTDITVNSPSLLEEASRRLCSMNYSQMLLLAEDEKRRLQNYCPSSVFITLLTLNGYGFDHASFPRISFQKKAGDTSVGWALGYMLSLSNQLPAETLGVRKALTPGAWWTLLFLFIFLVMGVFFFVFHQARNKRTKGSCESESQL
ncbi:ectonucleoside triphosphate diphosphohydrolase 2-like isoform X2 [Gouania willdenowi]|uniref:ectonucleoside triphosphate diphosphohydrolase 2-like isoform X2 n=1 Tax=Gouania willdenowi TaxID=441366 RepID=UPI001054E505|nr:ectonucleoside triphosphate diphosphohydrolase 2-like isoform X2 [Gouania willdenowi]